MPTINKDVEETRNIENHAKNKVEQFAFDLFVEAGNGDPRNILTMIDIFVAKALIILGNNTYASHKLAEVHNEHVHQAIDALTKES